MIFINIFVTYQSFSAMKHHLYRLILIIRLIQNNRYITFEKLGHKLEKELQKAELPARCSRNTLQRDIKEIREDLKINIQYNLRNNGYFIEDELNKYIDTLILPFENLFSSKSLRNRKKALYAKVDMDMEPEEVVLSFDTKDGSFIKSMPIDPSQEIITDTPDEFVIKLNTRVNYSFILELLSRSTSLKVISPEHLRKEIRGIFEKAFIRNI